MQISTCVWFAAAGAGLIQSWKLVKLALCMEYRLLMLYMGYWVKRLSNIMPKSFQILYRLYGDTIILFVFLLDSRAQVKKEINFSSFRVYMYVAYVGLSKTELLSFIFSRNVK
jgi:hypothetical protein